MKKWQIAKVGGGVLLALALVGALVYFKMKK
jgi:hypothetical protein